MKTKTTIFLAGAAMLIVAAGLLAKSIFHFEPQQMTYATGDLVAQAELERVLKKHGVQFTYGGTTNTKQSGNVTVTSTLQGSVVIKDAGAPNAVAAMKEFANWSASRPKMNND